MSDDLDHWLDELAGRRPGDALTQSLRDAVLRAPDKGVDELSYRRLLRRHPRD